VNEPRQAAAAELAEALREQGWSQTSAEREAEQYTREHGVMGARARADGPEPGTTEWQLQQGSYIDPEPDWDCGPPWVNPATGAVYGAEPAQKQCEAGS